MAETARDSGRGTTRSVREVVEAPTGAMDSVVEVRLEAMVQWAVEIR